MNYWQKNPPAHLAIKLAFLEEAGGSDSRPSNDSSAPSQDAAVQEFTFMPGVSNWVGGPPVTPEQVRQMAEKARGR